MISGLFAQSKANHNGRYKIQPKNSKITWYAEKVTGSHYGDLSILNGNISVENNQIIAGTASVDMTSITVSDIEHAEYNAKLVKHLKGKDFFDTENHKAATFEMTKFVAKKGEEDANYEIQGILTIKGISQPVRFPAKISFKENALQARGTIVFDRTKYDIQYRSGSYFDSLGDKMIYDEVRLKFELQATM